MTNVDCREYSDVSFLDSPGKKLKSAALITRALFLILGMPEISRFFGIIIKMFFKDHAPPHFHVEYGDFKAVVSIKEPSLLEGNLPDKQFKLVQAWALIHEEELLQNFSELNSNQPKWQKIDPLR